VSDSVDMVRAGLLSSIIEGSAWRRRNIILELVDRLSTDKQKIKSRGDQIMSTTCRQKKEFLDEKCHYQYRYFRG